ncbi:sensor histidine kinase [Thalassomonas actiniarum]|uniref:histidine kinase n=1 Tax=Thalassomonas actiniarum TaxID=485447 RepID=A0AAE9YKR4_9GAMM|nr:histidine kinase dimerization/phospho-acceptor domain-containing protein [Thalassomonas actiniarum]WDD97429.1 two-component sensor histidine kinase [Thalassomonas actiniarum]
MRIFPNNHLLNYAQRLRRLRYLAIGFLLCLLIPLGILLYFGFLQIEKNLLEQYQREASSLVQVTERTLAKRRMLTNALPADAFEYYQQVYNPVTRQSQQVLSPLAQLDFAQPKISQQLDGLVGFFQYNSQGDFNSPIWPYVLSDSSLSKEDTDKAGQQALAQPLNPALGPELLVRKETAVNIYQLLSQSKTIQQRLHDGLGEKQYLFTMAFDIPGYFIFYRVVSVAEQSRLQGYLVEREPYLFQLLTEVLEQRRFDSPIMIKLEDVKYSTEPEYFFYQNLPDGQVKVSREQQAEPRFQQQVIYSNRLRWPYDGYSLSLSTNSLPMTPAMVYSSVFIIVLIAAILSACYGFYRLSVKQLALGEQRLNFVSSVSHELKTPLTSIQMYSQMLKEGTVISEEYQKEYYEFIYAESERLTRLINNILQLSKLSHQQQAVQPEHTPLTVLLDIIRSKTSSLIDKHGFQQNMMVEIANAAEMLVFVDKDAFSQVIINITDNAVKFFDQEQINDAGRQKIDFIFRQHAKSKQLIQMEIRDYGQGITPEQESKIFELFYRGGDELTRTTQGTGIGLALVNELVSAQQGEIKVERREPGLAMLLSFHVKY